MKLVSWPNLNLRALLILAVSGLIAQGNAESLTKVKVALSAFQDVESIHVGIEKGFYKEAGIEPVIQNTDWPGSNELLMSGHVDLGTSSDADIVLQNARGVDTTLAFPLYYFAGGGLMFDPKKHAWKTLDDFKGQGGGDLKAAIKKTLEQAKGAKVGVSSGGGEYASFIQMLTVASLNPADYQIVDLAQEDLPPALLSGSIDIMIAGIPQRLAVLKQGYATLMDQTSLPDTVVHCGFGASRAWIDKNPELAVRFQKVIFKTLDFIKNNPDEGFGIISKHLHEDGTDESVEDLKRVWNVMEIFPDSKAWFDEKVVSPTGQFYWKSRFETVVKNLQAQGRVQTVSTPLADMNYALKIVSQIGR